MNRFMLVARWRTKANKWQGRNITRWRNEEYDQPTAPAEGELDPVKRAALFIRMNDLVCSDTGRHPGRQSAATCAAVEPQAAWRR